MTLIEVRKNGSILGRCTSKCFLGSPALRDRCTCVCEGLNHGVGLEEALENLPRLVNEWVDYPGGRYEVVVRSRVAQLEFDFKRRDYGKQMGEL